MPTFSVVIPSHNRPDDVRAAVADLRRQALQPTEVLVVDDGSTPPLDLADLQQAAGQIPVTLLRNEQPTGPGAARNRGVEAAKGDWVVFLDDDDRFATRKLSTIAAAIDRAPAPDLVHHPALIRMVREGISYTSSPADLEAIADPYRELLISNSIGGTSMVAVRRSALLDAGGFDPQIRNMEDHELWLRLAKSGARFRRVPQVLTEYRSVTGGGNLSSDLEAFWAGADRIAELHRDGYATLSPQQLRDREVWLLNSATVSALVHGDTVAARRLQWRALRRRPSLLAAGRAAATLLGPKTAFRLRARMSRGPTAAA